MKALPHSAESACRLASLAHTLVPVTQMLCSEVTGAASLIDSPSKGAVFPPERIDLLPALLRTYRPGFALVEQFASQANPPIPAPAVADDVAEFVAAVPHASGGRHG